MQAQLASVGRGQRKLRGIDDASGGRGVHDRRIGAGDQGDACGGSRRAGASLCIGLRLRCHRQFELARLLAFGRVVRAFRRRTVAGHRANRNDAVRILDADAASGHGTAVAVGHYITNDIYVEIVTDARGYTATQIEISLTPSLSVLSQMGSFGGSSINVRYRKDY